MKYDIQSDVKYGPLELADVGRLVDACAEPWWSQTLCRVNDSVARVGVFKGESLLFFAKLMEMLNVNDRSSRVIGFDNFAGFPSLHAKDGATDEREDKRAGGWSSAEGRLCDFRSRPHSRRRDDHQARYPCDARTRRVPRARVAEDCRPRSSARNYTTGLLFCW